MEPFKVYNPTCLFFGKSVLEKLGECVKEFGSKVLIIYGKGSVKKNGAFNDVMVQLKSNNCTVYEYSNIQSNPLYEDVDAASEIVKKHHVDLIIAVGGGSVIDTAKMVSVASCVEHSSWDFFIKKTSVQNAIPLFCVLTLAATGSEMNPYAVIQNNKTLQKLSFGHNLMFPKYSFLDPSYTLSVPRDYTAYGIVDIISHALEAYFGKGKTNLIDGFVIEIIKETMLKGKMLLEDLSNYDLRSDIMLASTVALNGTTMYGRAYGDWGAHSVGHVLSSLYGLPHGASLSIVYPAWLKIQSKRIENRIQLLGKHLFNETQICEIIKNLEDFLRAIEVPVKLSQFNIVVNKDDIVNALIQNKANGYVHKFSEDDYGALVDYMID